MSASSHPSLTDSLHTGWRWWTSELMEFVPGRQRGAKAHERKALVVSLDPAGPRIIDERFRGRGTLKADPAAAIAADTWDTVADLGKGRRAGPVWIRLPHAACFVRRVELPPAARRDAGRLLNLDLERTTPFRQKDIYTAHYIDEARSTRKVLHVCQLVVRREDVDGAIANVRSAGVTLAGVDCWNEDGTSALPVNFLQSTGPDTQASRSPRFNRLLLASALVLTLSAAAIAIDRHEGALAELTQQTGVARDRAAAARKAHDGAQAAMDQIEAVRKLKASNTSAVEILDTLTRLLPDTAWVTDFRLDGSTLDISGEADSAAGLISLLENSDLFGQAAFTAPVTRDGRGGKESFSLRVRVDARTSAGEAAP